MELKKTLIKRHVFSATITMKHTHTHIYIFHVACKNTYMYKNFVYAAHSKQLPLVLEFREINKIHLHT